LFSARLYFREAARIVYGVQPLKAGVRLDRRQINRFHPGGQIEIRHEFAPVEEERIKITQREEELAAPDEMSNPQQGLAIKHPSLFHVLAASPLFSAKPPRPPPL